MANWPDIGIGVLLKTLGNNQIPTKIIEQRANTIQYDPRRVLVFSVDGLVTGRQQFVIALPYLELIDQERGDMVAQSIEFLLGHF